jgi:DNA-binding transcriptional LysR family regulator
MDWDNLRFFLELARAGTLVAAARRLGVDHTTVARRMQALEKQAGRAPCCPRGRRPPPDRSRAAPAARGEAMEAAVLSN